ncbi:MAG: DUF308 domain-containing protein [Clostridium sp.]|nr:DUF308 domain-containing protein [Clostridium sp.]
MRPKSTLFYGMLVMAIGILLIVFSGRGELLNWVVILAGISLIIPCLYTLVATITDERRAASDGADTFSLRMMTSGVVITSVLGIALGIWMLAAPNFFIRFIAYAFAVLLIVYGVYHICVLVWLCRPAVLPWGLYIIPVLMVIAGIAILATSLHDLKSAVIIITGIGLIGSGFSSILEYVSAKGQRKVTDGNAS